ncbi:hypothetical protein LIER_04876 [Lithospermum erythrorhizon]|uniref:Transposase (putative) gypsy type domain-containing protein n=1 Tax=Lithospermum erythrorhizon TaxID=34254 RepID=A0AAV3NYL9_LITER
MRFPFSSFVNNLLIKINRTPGQLNPIGGWLNVTIFEVACRIVGVEPSVSLFSALFTVTHEDFKTTFRARRHRNILAGKRPNRVPKNRLFKKWFFARCGLAVDPLCSSLRNREPSPIALVYVCRRSHVGVCGSRLR